MKLRHVIRNLRYPFGPRYFWFRLKEDFWHWLARKMPKPLRYWAVIVAGAEVTSGKYGDTVVPELLYIDVLKRMDAGNGTTYGKNNKAIA